MLLTIANILIRTGYRRFKIPAISSAILFELQRTMSFLNSERYFCRSRQKNGTFYGVVCGNTRYFVKKIANLPRFWILSLFFEKNANAIGKSVNAIGKNRDKSPSF